MYIKSAIEDNAILTLLAYVKAMRLKVTRSSVEETLLTHPDYPSMLSLSDALNKWKVENGVVKMSPVDLLKLNVPFITYLREDGGIFAFVRLVKDDSVEWRHSQKGWRKEAFGDFVTKWNGTALIGESSGESGEAGYSQKRQLEILRFLSSIGTGAAVVAILLILCYLQLWKLPAEVQLRGIVGVLLVNILGFFTCLGLALIHLHPENELARKFCGAGDNTGCNKVLESDGAKLAGILTWSDVGLFYFASSVSLTFFSIADNDLLCGLALMNFLSLPFTIFSIYYQAYVLKAWCRLCLLVQAILWVSCVFTTLSIGGVEDFSLRLFKSFPFLAISLLTALVVTKLLTNYLFITNELKRNIRDIRRLKYNKGVLDYLLSMEKGMPELPVDLDLVVFGDRASENVVTVVTNPFCEPCSQMHGEILKLFREGSATQVQFIFTSTNDPDDLRGEFVRRLMTFSDDTRIKHLNEWYKLKEKDLAQWNAGVDTSQNISAYQTVDLYRAWCRAANIVKTPTIYVNGRELPKVYGLNDVKLIIG